MNMKKIKNLFYQHVSNFDMNDSKIKLKYEHSYRVMDICKDIAIDLNLNEEDIKLAMVIGILHDYARFEQWRDFKTFSDAKSIDHGNFAVKKLFADNEIKKFAIPMQHYETILESIKYHNKFGYPENVSKRDLMFCQLIKDADKLDIFYLISMDQISMFDDNSPVSEDIDRDFFENKLLRKESIETNSDRIVFYLSMMYDLNFKYSYKYLKNNNLIDKIFNLVKSNEKFEPYFDHISEYVDERSKEYVRKKI